MDMEVDVDKELTVLTHAITTIEVLTFAMQESKNPLFVTTTSLKTSTN
jgi:hypothetical protein